MILKSIYWSYAIVIIKCFWNSAAFVTQEFISSQQIIIVLLIYILPISDTTSVFINKLLKTISIIGGKDHYSSLIIFNFNDTQVIFIFSGIAFLSSLIAIALYRFGDNWTIIKFILYFIYILAVFLTLYITTQQHKDLRK